MIRRTLREIELLLWTMAIVPVEALFWSVANRRSRLMDSMDNERGAK